jgi:hypothetical protein
MSIHLYTDKIVFDSYEDYNAAKELGLKTIEIGEPNYEVVDGLLTGRFSVHHGFNTEMIAEFASLGISLSAQPNLAEVYNLV